MDTVHDISRSGLFQAGDSGINRELKPNLNRYFKMARFRTNSAGLRDKEYPIRKAPGTFRVAVLGDSFTMPAGVEIEDAFHEYDRPMGQT
ncbi:MAG: hypothetical protein ABH891_00160 [Candidatus Omnitrophota bacterium]